MKQCGIYEILQYIVNDGSIIWSCTVNGKQQIKLISKKGDECVGYVSKKTFESLCNCGALVETCSGTDKYGTIYRYHALFSQNERLKQKAFALACRILDDNLPVTLTDNLSWQDYIFERALTEPVCRMCGCTEDNACPGGCYWVEPDLCSSCANENDGRSVCNE